MKKAEIEWKYFFGGSGGKNFDRYYFAIIDGVRIERHDSNKGRRYSIGNMDEAKQTYESEDKLLDALTQPKTDKP